MQYEQGPAVPDTYSTAEQVVGKWIDGSPIYRKVLPISSTTAGGTDSTIQIADSSSVPGRMINVGGYITINGYTCSIVGGRTLVQQNPQGNIVLQFTTTWATGTWGGHAIIDYIKP